jgi:hypothetical protein
MIVFGRNGHGKSSITDAWEWFHNEKIARLAKEGAGAAAFPHRHAQANAGECYVEVEFADEGLGTTRLTFDHKRITKPRATGNLANFRALAPHPCHLRYDDLTRFVYLPKAEQHDTLAQLMGFTPQVEFQKMLRRALRQLGEKVEVRRQNVVRFQAELETLLGDNDISEPAVLEKLNSRIRGRGIPEASSFGDIRSAQFALQAQVKNDPRAQELADLGGLRRCLESSTFPVEVSDELKVYANEVETFKQGARATLDLLLVNLYELGQEVLESRIAQDQQLDRCPLCGNHFEGDLREHISSELAALRELKAARDSLEAQRNGILALLNPAAAVAEVLRSGLQDVQAVTEKTGTAEVLRVAQQVDGQVRALLSSLMLSPEQLHTDTASEIRTAGAKFAQNTDNFELLRQAALVRVTSLETTLTDDAHRTQLVSDYDIVTSVLGVWDKLRVASAGLERIDRVHSAFDTVVENFIVSSIADVQGRFDLISADVDRYFGILEARTDGLAHPTLRLLADQDRAVMLEIEFRGEPISPAYKYLSESQLNSFGLSLFLASARRFNGSFRFLLLDDIVNSFDGYKRPQVIKLLKTEFHDFQLLLLTHDEVWAEQLFKAFPDWVRKRFTRFEAGTGPVMGDGLSDLEKIEGDLHDDEPVRAGQLMGPLMERELQALCEAFEVLVTYNRRNEYTLTPLLSRFKERVKDKLENTHPLYAAVAALENDMAFRNFCAHWKEPSTPISTPEMMEVVEKWKAIVELVRCKEAACSEYAEYDGTGFKCGCGALTLSRSRPTRNASLKST